MIQGGDPTGTGEGGASVWGRAFKDEPHQRLKFSRRGLLASANQNEPDTNQSQFFFTLDRCPWLDRKHTIFGRVEGDTVYNLTRLAEYPTDKESDRPVGDPQDIPRVTGSEVIWNPFDDIVPRTTRAERLAAQEQERAAREADQKAADAKSRVKKVHLLSFGGKDNDSNDSDSDDDEEDRVANKKRNKDKPPPTQRNEEEHERPRSAPDLRHTDTDTDPGSGAPGDGEGGRGELARRQVRKRKEREDDDHDHDHYHPDQGLDATARARARLGLDRASNPTVEQRLDHPRAIAAAATDEAQDEHEDDDGGGRGRNKDGSVLERPERRPSPSTVSEQKEKEGEPTRKAVGLYDRRAMLERFRSRASARRPTHQRGVVDGDLLTSHQKNRKEALQRRAALGEREDAMVAKMDRFVGVLRKDGEESPGTGAGAGADGEKSDPDQRVVPKQGEPPDGGGVWRVDDYLDGSDDDDLGALRSHKLAFKGIKGNMTRRDDVDDYVVEDPRLEKHKGKYARRAEEQRGRSDRGRDRDGHRRPREDRDVRDGYQRPRRDPREDRHRDTRDRDRSRRG